MVYLKDDQVHSSETWRAIEENFDRGGMKRLTEEAVARHAEVLHYSTSAEIRIGGDRSVNSEFWPLVLEGPLGVRLII